MNETLKSPGQLSEESDQAQQAAIKFKINDRRRFDKDGNRIVVDTPAPVEAAKPTVEIPVSQDEEAEANIKVTDNRTWDRSILNTPAEKPVEKPVEPVEPAFKVTDRRHSAQPSLEDTPVEVAIKPRSVAESRPVLTEKVTRRARIRSKIAGLMVRKSVTETVVQAPAPVAPVETASHTMEAGIPILTVPAEAQSSAVESATATLEAQKAAQPAQPEAFIVTR